MKKMVIMSILFLSSLFSVAYGADYRQFWNDLSRDDKFLYILASATAYTQGLTDAGADEKAEICFKIMDDTALESWVQEISTYYSIGDQYKIIPISQMFSIAMHRKMMNDQSSIRSALDVVLDQLSK